MIKYFSTPIKYKRPEISVQDIVKFIEKGEKFLKLDDNESYDIMEYINGIIISPDYQRSYKSTLKEESSIIESLLIGIPIPEIFLIRNNNNQLKMRHVMDGQHRLNAIYRFVNNKFSLKGLELRKEYNNNKFSDLSIDDKIKILGSNLSILEFEGFERSEEEIELFKRYNTNTKKLEVQEIEMVTYFSETNKYISNFINKLIENKNNEMSDEYKLYSIYNITNVRNSKQRNHQEICVILNIIENGLIDIRNANDISKNFLKRKSDLFKEGKDENLSEIKEEFKKFNEFILNLSDNMEYPFSPRILKDMEESKLNKFSIGLAIVYAALWHYFDVDTSSKDLITEVKDFILKTPIGDPDYNGSTTNLNMISKYIFDINPIKNMNYNSLKLKK